MPAVMDDWLLLGVMAGLLTTVGFIPQILKSVRTRRMDEVSLLMPLLLSLGMFLWFLYGVLKGDAAIILWNAVSLTLNLTLVALKLHHRGLEGGAIEAKT
jgi:MtN3 and saliva related transmembrane protein